MERKHTPGPWIHDGEDIDAGQVAVATIHHRVGAMFKTKGPVPSETQAFANARLIAAAPDLLEAAKLAEYIIYDFVAGGPDEKAEKALEALQAAIRKAHGE